MSTVREGESPSRSCHADWTPTLSTEDTLASAILTLSQPHHDGDGGGDVPGPGGRGWPGGGCWRSSWGEREEWCLLVWCLDWATTCHYSSTGGHQLAHPPTNTLNTELGTARTGYHDIQIYIKNIYNIIFFKSFERLKRFETYSLK